jgi:hypothetical protein
MLKWRNTVAYLLHAEAVEPEKQPLLRVNFEMEKYCGKFAPCRSCGARETAVAK